MTWVNYDEGGGYLQGAETRLNGFPPANHNFTQRVFPIGIHLLQPWLPLNPKVLYMRKTQDAMACAHCVSPGGALHADCMHI